MSIDRFFFRTYHTTNYNCAHFACEVWESLTGQNLSIFMAGFLTGVGERRAILSNVRNFKRLKYPQSPCFALFQTSRMPAHVGIYIRGRIFHIQKRGVEYQPISVVLMGFKEVSFFTWQNK